MIGEMAVEAAIQSIFVNVRSLSGLPVRCPACAHLMRMVCARPQFCSVESRPVRVGPCPYELKRVLVPPELLSGFAQSAVSRLRPGGPAVPAAVVEVLVVVGDPIASQPVDFQPLVAACVRRRRVVPGVHARRAGDCPPHRREPADCRVAGRCAPLHGAVVAADVRFVREAPCRGYEQEPELLLACSEARGLEWRGADHFDDVLRRRRRRDQHAQCDEDHPGDRRPPDACACPAQVIEEARVRAATSACETFARRLRRCLLRLCRCARVRP